MGKSGLLKDYKPPQGGGTTGKAIRKRAVLIIMDDNLIKFPSFPLLGKELMEQANRKRTYLIRVVFIVILGIISVTLLKEIFSQSVSTGNASGGFKIYQAVILCQFFAVLIFLPGVMSGVITLEKERSSLELLFLTHMRPWEIVIQKYLSRVIPVLMFFFLGLPLIAVAYSFGGLDSDAVYKAPLIILLLIFHIGAFSIMFSAFFATTVSAVVCSYLMTAVELSLIIYIAHSVNDMFLFTLLFMPFTTALFLWLSVVFLKSRSLARRNYIYMRFLGSVDKFWKRVNKYFGGVEVLSEGNSPGPGDSPFEWYDRMKSPVGRLSYKIRLMLILYVPVLICLAYYVAEDTNLSAGTLVFFRILFAIYLLAVILTVAVCGASAISAEKSGQTLDILLTTLIPPRDIVRHKMKKCREYIIIFMIPVTIQGMMVEDFKTEAVAQYIIFIAVFFCIHLPLIAWFSCWVGLSDKSQARAMLISLVSIAVWMIFPVIIAFFTQQLISSGGGRDAFLYFSPTIPFAEIFVLGEDFSSGIGFAAWSFVLFWVYIFLRSLCMERAQRYLRQR